MRLTGLLSDTPKLLANRPLFSNANGAFRRSLWLEQPFDERVGGAEDIAWVRSMQERGYLIAYQPTAAVYHSHGEPLVRHLRRASRDVPTVIGNLLHLGSGGRTRKPAHGDAITPAPDRSWAQRSANSDELSLQPATFGQVRTCRGACRRANRKAQDSERARPAVSCKAAFG